MACKCHSAFQIVPEIQSPQKRKRCADKIGTPSKPEAQDNDSGIKNEAFSSTPKRFSKRFTRSVAKSPLFRNSSKENHNPFLTNPCLEVKSIYDIAHQKLNTIGIPEANPFEVIRKPPKKKKKESEIKNACFENPALNLAVSEKHFNPFEVVRHDISPKTPKKCFVNAALNIRGKDVYPNPFEVPRPPTIDMEISSNIKGIENEALEIQHQQSVLQIGLPFAACVGCRINFKNMPLNDITPSKLLAEKLVFSPDQSENTPRSLSTISEETLDIGRELDRYQLELENSINEKKMNNFNQALPIQSTANYTFTKKLTDIMEADEEKISEDNLNSNNSLNDVNETETKIGETLCDTNHDTLSVIDDDDKENVPLEREEIEQNPKNTSQNESLAESSYNDDSDFIAPAPFVRAYRKPEPPPLTISRGNSKESLQSNKSDKSNGSNKQKSKVKSIIRNSIRRLIHPNASHKKMQSDQEGEKSGHSEEPHQPVTIMETIRHSLRRKPQKNTKMQMENNVNCHEVSIIDNSERTMKLKTNLTETDYMKIEELTTEKKPSFRNSIRKSTRGVRNQIMKSVFHKDSEEFIFKK